MQYKVIRNNDKGYDMLVHVRPDGLIQSVAYVSTDYAAHIVIELISDTIVTAFMLDSSGNAQASTVMHVKEITEKHAVMHKLVERICEECSYYHSWKLQCDLEDMLDFANLIMN